MMSDIPAQSGLGRGLRRNAPKDGFGSGNRLRVKPMGFAGG
jgi:hypothetical protein